MKLFLVVVLSMLLSGCASIAKGIAEAVIEKKEEQNTKLCEIVGKRFSGIEPSFLDKKGKTKVLKIHGVGNHVPGHSAEFLEKLANKLDMPVQSSHYKEIQLRSPLFPDKKLGILRVKRLLNADETKELLFYELTWSEITAAKKAELDYDTSGEESYRRAAVNDMLKRFSNSSSPDPMIYLGSGHEEILASFKTAFCWMVNADWDQLPNRTNQFCDPLTEEAIANLLVDNYSFVSHSLGSRIMIDGLQDIVRRISDKREQGELLDKESAFSNNLQNTQISIYMMSNQLPLLQMAREKTEITGDSEAYCSEGGEHYNDRIVKKTEIVAFSDPNDILSYTIAEGFAEKYFDSRLCIEITNVTINVADVIDLMGFGTIANPISAHTFYGGDDRVVALIANGIGNANSAAIISDECKWIRLVD